ncbi:MAG: restriction endonuclease [Bacteroidales bacterium]|nr:restriction endonuclease [Bacteroidales bacterium]
MPNQVSVKKSSGESQHFSEEKLYHSLRNAGASEETVQSVIFEIRKDLYEGITTRSIYRRAFQLLRRKVHATAGRYSLKNAIMELGPTGYPFETYIGELLKRLGYETLTSQIIQGRCVSHEVDVVAWNRAIKLMIECKYHNIPGKVCSVQVPLYIQSRFIDVRSTWETLPENRGLNFTGWVVTNTRFSDDAATYGRCAGLHLVGWDYPRHGSLKELIETTSLFPVTAISGLNMKQKQMLIDHRIVLCSELVKDLKVLEMLRLSARDLRNVTAEIYELSGIVS